MAGHRVAVFGCGFVAPPIIRYLNCLGIKQVVATRTPAKVLPVVKLLKQGLKYLFLTLPNSDSGCAHAEVPTGSVQNMGKFCAFTMAWRRFRYVSEVSH